MVGSRTIAASGIVRRMRFRHGSETTKLSGGAGETTSRVASIVGEVQRATLAPTTGSVRISVTV
jgi:hypothetical protein